MAATVESMTKTLMRVRGMLMHLSMLVQDADTKAAIRETMDELDDVDAFVAGDEDGDDE